MAWSLQFFILINESIKYPAQSTEPNQNKNLGANGEKCVGLYKIALREKESVKVE